jgi:hypothetical protein
MWERSKGRKALFDPQSDARRASYRRFHGHAGSAFSRNSRSASGDRLSRGLEAVGWPSLGPRRSSRSYDRRASAESFGRPSAAILSRNSFKVFSESSGMADPAAEEHGIDISAVGQGWFRAVPKLPRQRQSQHGPPTTGCSKDENAPRRSRHFPREAQVLMPPQRGVARQRPLILS